MESVASSSSVPAHQEASNYDEYSMKQSLLFGNSLKDLKNLREQLYSAADYFEKCYRKDDQKQIVFETLKDYAIKALVNTVDHLGSVTYKVNTFLDNKIGEVRGTELQFSCIEQWLSSTVLGDKNSQTPQANVRKTSFNLPGWSILGTGVQTTNATGQNKPSYQTCSPYAEDHLHQFYKGVDCFTEGCLSTPRDMPSAMIVGRGHSTRPSPRSSPRPGAFPFSITRNSSSKERDKRAVSPNYFPLIRSGSLASRSTSPNSSKTKLRNPSEPRSALLFTRAERDRAKDIEQLTSKSKRLFKALISMRNSKKDGTLYRYMDGS